MGAGVAGSDRGWEVGLYLGIIVQMVPTHFGRSGERGVRQGAPSRRRRSGPACADGRVLSVAPEGAGKQQRGGGGPDTPRTAEAATAAAMLTGCRAGGESRPDQLCNSLSSHFDSLRLRGRF